MLPERGSPLATKPVTITIIAVRLHHAMWLGQTHTKYTALRRMQIEPDLGDTRPLQHDFRVGMSTNSNIRLGHMNRSLAIRPLDPHGHLPITPQLSTHNQDKPASTKGLRAEKTTLLV